MRIANSFTEGEIQVMDFILQTLLRGGSPTMATRNRDFASLCRKIMAMKAKVAEKAAAEAKTKDDALESAPTVTDEASTGEMPVLAG